MALVYEGIVKGISLFETELVRREHNFMQLVREELIVNNNSQSVLKLVS